LPGTPYVFGPFEIDPATGELRKQGLRLKLARQPFQVLVALLERPGEVVTREELQNLLWKGSSFVDSDHGLNAAMNRLRQTLGDSADTPRYIETIPGRGYRFIGSLRGEIPPPPPPAPPARTRKGLWLTLALAAAGIAVGWLIRGLMVPPAAEPVQFLVPPPPGYTFEPGGTRQSFALSPDGNHLAFGAIGSEGFFHLWLRTFASAEPRLLAGTQRAHTLFWDPDSRHVFFTAGGQIRRMPLAGGAFERVAESDAAIQGAAILPSGDLLTSSPLGALLFPATTQKPVALDGPPVLWPQPLPGGKLLFVTRNPGSPRFEARLASDLSARELGAAILESDSKVVYAPSAATPERGHLLFIRNGQLLAQPFAPSEEKLLGPAIPLAPRIFYWASGAAEFSAARNAIAWRQMDGGTRLIWVDRAGRERGSLTPGDVISKSVRLSPDGSRAAVSQYNTERGATEIWIYDLARGEKRLLAGGPGFADGPVWSPDGRLLAYGRGVGGPPRLVCRPVEGEGPETPLPRSIHQVPTTWSPDGRFLLTATTAFVAVGSERVGDVEMVDFAHPRTVSPLLNSPFHEAAAEFAPAGRWLTFTSNESGRPELYLQAYETTPTLRLVGTRRQISRHGAITCRWRPDGKEIFYLGVDNNLYAVPTELTPTLRTSEPERLFSIPLAARSVLPLLLSIDVTRDGQRFLLPAAPAQPSPIVVTRNWESLLLKAPGTP
jgi:DNA-binding winged helix-turn-helix (wHTH) protein/Tol biopolymer transport system component